MTAAYMRILIHTMNNSLFPDADPGSTTWTGPPREITIVQSLLYASLTTSLFAAFLAMLGKQWVNRYLRNRGGSAADKSRDRQQKLDGFEKWHFRLTIESLPVMLQLALLLLGCALSRYLWTISRTVAGVIAAVTIFGITLYIFLTLAAILCYDCPYQTPPSTFARAVIRYLVHGNDTLTLSPRSLAASFPSVKALRRVIGRFCTGIRSAVGSLGCVPGAPGEVERIPFTIVTSAQPGQIFDDVPIDWDVYKADIRCVSWILSSTTDADVIYSTARFAADTIWYPEVVGALSPHVLADLFFDCLFDGRVVPGKLEHASSIGMALASILSSQLATKPDQERRDLCERIGYKLTWRYRPDLDQPLSLVVSVLTFIEDITTRQPYPDRPSLMVTWSIPDHLSSTQKLWFSRVILQTIWGWRRVRGTATVLRLLAMESICKIFTVDGHRNLTILQTNFFLTMAIALGLQIDICNLFAPSDRCVTPHLSD